MGSLMHTMQGLESFPHRDRTLRVITTAYKADTLVLSPTILTWFCAPGHLGDGTNVTYNGIVPSTAIHQHGQWRVPWLLFMQRMWILQLPYT